VIPFDLVSLAVMLVVPDAGRHQRMMRSQSHSKRAVSPENFATNRLIQEWLIEQAKSEGMQIVPNDDREETCSQVVLRLPGHNA
jgi:2-phosphoglycerate kinase